MLTWADLDDMSHARQEAWLPRFRGSPRPRISMSAAPHDTWSSWMDLLCERPSDPPKHPPLSIECLPGLPGFRTICASLVAVSSTGAIRFDFAVAPFSRFNWSRIV
jgi:hypothetical protein